MDERKHDEEPVVHDRPVTLLDIFLAVKALEFKVESFESRMAAAERRITGLERIVWGGPTAAVLLAIIAALVTFAVTH